MLSSAYMQQDLCLKLLKIWSLTEQAIERMRLHESKQLNGTDEAAIFFI